jgi:hypothetical protein
MQIQVFRKCEDCGKYRSIYETHDQGDKVNFVMRSISINKMSVQLTNVEGKLEYIDQNDIVNISKGKKWYEVPRGKVTSSRGVNALSVGIGDKCECNGDRYV